MKKINRRELLKLGLFSSLSPSIAGNPFREKTHDLDKKPQNVLIILFDALSANNINFYGYSRETMPNLSKLLDKATVFHNHYAGGPFTTPGTASLLTGTYPWTHRGLRSFGTVISEFANKNIFSLFNDHYSFAYTHNPLANVLLEQFSHNIDNWLPIESLYIKSDWISQLFMKDYDTASLSERQIFIPGNRITYSLLFSNIYQYFSQEQRNKVLDLYADEFPRGVPKHGTNSVDRYFDLEKAIDWLIQSIPAMENPFLGYFHLLPPHEPYNTRKDFIDTFLNDGIVPLNKPEHFFAKGTTYPELVEFRRTYDEYILYADAEFGRLFDQLNDTGILDNTILVFTSDHGEMFERGIKGHSTPALFVPGLHIPLIIFHPEQETRIDIQNTTSAVDVLPTLLHLTGQQVPDWCEGSVLPPYNTNWNEKEIYSVHSRKYSVGKPINQGSFMILKDEYKLTHYLNYEYRKDKITFSELYNIYKDPEELDNLFEQKAEIGKELLDILIENKTKADLPYK